MKNDEILMKFKRNYDEIAMKLWWKTMKLWQNNHEIIIK